MTRNSRLRLLAGVGVIAVVAFVPLAGRGGEARADNDGDDGASPVGLSLFFQNGVMPPIALVGNRPRYLQEIDIVATTPPSSVDDGINPLITSSELSVLDWSGVTMVEEDWRSPDGVSFQRQRFYRGADWMDKPSDFTATPVDTAGHPVGPPLVASAGKDDKWKNQDDGFVRRFDVRQIAIGCPAVNNCSGATFITQGLVQLRDAMHADDSARPIPIQAAALKLRWNRDTGPDRSVSIARVDPTTLPYGYGFEISLDRVTSPGADGFFAPGDSVTFRVTFRDGQGNRLHPPGSLPTYGQFLRGEVTSGLRYFDGFRLAPTTYYALKHRESNLIATLSGPTDRYKTPTMTIGPEQFFLPQATVATVPADGYSALAQGIPAFGVTFGGAVVPSLWETPVSDLVTFQIPGNAGPGTYVAAVKARRDFGGEALNRGTTTDIQVGTTTPTTFSPTTGPCTSCHAGPSQLSHVLHGISDRRACYACHASLAFEPDGALDIRVHMVHDRSRRFPASIQDCSTCHLTPPSGPARGLLP